MIELGEVDSTNDYLRRPDVQGDGRTVLVTAEFQTAGRGAGQNHWESARGENLLFSLGCMPTALPVSRMFAISEVTALAIRDALCHFLPATATGGVRGIAIKWPNDIYYEDSKVAGILIENNLWGSRVMRSIIGVGINVNQRRFLSDAPNPRSLADIVGHDVERRAVLERFMDSFMPWMQKIDKGRQDVLDALHETYKSHLYHFGEEHTYSDKDGIFRATLVDVEPSGHLILQDREGRQRRYAFKEVKSLLPPCASGKAENQP